MRDLYRDDASALLFVPEMGLCEVRILYRRFSQPKYSRSNYSTGLLAKRGRSTYGRGGCLLMFEADRCGKNLPLSLSVPICKRESREASASGLSRTAELDVAF
jgi:hypothetical protein